METQHEVRHGTTVQNRGGIAGDAVSEEGRNGICDVPTTSTVEAVSDIQESCGEALSGYRIHRWLREDAQQPTGGHERKRDEGQESRGNDATESDTFVKEDEQDPKQDGGIIRDSLHGD